MISRKIFLLDESGECVTCAKNADFYCERCGDTYCSNICQLKDWREHRRICFPMPRLVSRSSIRNVPSIASSTVEIHSSDVVDAIGISAKSPADLIPLPQNCTENLSKSMNTMKLDTGAKNDTKMVERSTNLAYKSPDQKIDVEPMVPTKDVPDKRASAQPGKLDFLSQSMKTNGECREPPKPVQKPTYKPSIVLLEKDDRVFITHVEDHRVIYVYPHRRYNEWQNWIERIDRSSQKCATLKNAPEIGHIVLAQCKTADVCARAIVTRVRADKNMAKVDFLDFGFSEIVQFNEMMALPVDLVNEPCRVNKVTLATVPLELDNVEQAVHYLNRLREENTVLFLRDIDLMEQTDISVHWRAIVVETERFLALNDEVIKCGKPIPQTQPSEPIEVMDEINNIDYVGFDGDNIQVLIVDNSCIKNGFISCIPANKQSEFAKYAAIISSASNDIAASPAFNATKNQVCLAQSTADGGWYRALATNQVDPNIMNVLYIDYGNFEKVPMANIRKIRPDCLFKCITVMCFIDGVDAETIGANAIGKLLELLPSFSTFRFDHVDYFKDEVYAKCKSSAILDQLSH